MCCCFAQSMTFILMCMPELHITISDEVVQWQYFFTFVLDLALTILNLFHPWEDTLKMQVLSIAQAYSSVLSDKNRVTCMYEHSLVCWPFGMLMLCSVSSLMLLWAICNLHSRNSHWIFSFERHFFSIFILFKTAQAFIWRKILQ